MLVTCPQCGARYEIEGSLIPAAGRRVQCSACDHVWQQDPASASDPDRDEELPRERPPLAEDVKSILREEAEREARVRRERGLVEIRPEPEPAAPLRPAAVARPLPDPASIDATLRAASERGARGHELPSRSGRGEFLAGLIVGLALVAVAAALYAAAPWIAEAAPATAPALRDYVGFVDELRLTLDGTISGRAGTSG